MHRKHMTILGGVVLVGVGLVAASLGGVFDSDEPSPSPAAEPQNGETNEPADEGAHTPGGDAEVVAAGGLTEFDSCDPYLAYAQEYGTMMVGPHGLDDRNVQRAQALGQDAAADDEAATDDAADAAPVPEPAPQEDAGSPIPGQDFSETNVQEEGVDEPDMVKTDGDTMYVLAQNEVQILDVSGDDLELLGSIPTGEGWRSGLLLHGDRLLITADEPAISPITPGSEMPAVGSGQFATLTLVDVSNPADPATLEQLVMDGQISTSRMVDGTVRLVTHAEPGNLPFEPPQGSGLRAAHQATQYNQNVVAESDADDWIPYYLHETADGDVTEGSLVACDRITHPEPFSGLGTTTVLSLDLARDGLLPPDRDTDTGAPANATAVLAGVDTTYASQDHLHVVTNRWIFDEDETDDTQLHTFDITDAATAEYVGSGTVEGRVSDQWALSEHDGFLRVVTESGDTWRQAEGEPPAVGLTVLELTGDGPQEVSRVDDLGMPERLGSVRFTDDIAFVTTGAEDHGLTTVDLRDPGSPEIVGELELLGPSSYLHPLNEDRMIGLGRHVQDEGPNPLVVSLLDISDPAAVEVVAEADMEMGRSTGETNHQAFLYWEPAGIVVMPFAGWDSDPEIDEERPRNGAAVFTVEDDTVTEQDRLSQLPHLVPDGADLGEAQHWASRSGIERSVVVGNDLLTVSEIGVASYDVENLTETGWARFAE